MDPELDFQGETEQGTHLNDEDGEDDHEEEDNSDDGVSDDDETEDEDEVGDMGYVSTIQYSTPALQRVRRSNDLELYDQARRQSAGLPGTGSRRPITFTEQNALDGLLVHIVIWTWAA